MLAHFCQKKMQFLKFVAFFSLCFASEAEVDEADVTVLTDSSFKDFVAKNPLSLIECKELCLTNR